MIHVRRFIPTLIVLLSLAVPPLYAQLHPPRNLMLQHDGVESVTLSWEPPLPGNDTLVQYHLYRNGYHLAIVPGGMTETTHALPQPGTYTFTLRALYDGGLSEPSNERSANWYDPGSGSFLETFEAGMPASWTIEANAASNSWAVAVGGPTTPFPTDHMHLVTDTSPFQGSFDNLFTPPLDMSEATSVVLRFESSLTDFFTLTDLARVIVRVDDTDTELFAWQDQTLPAETWEVDISDEAAGAGNVKIGFLHTSDGWFGSSTWSLDNVEIITDVGGDNPVIFDLVPMVTDVPAAGGPVYFDLRLTSTLDTTVPGLGYWTWVTRDGDTVAGPFPPTSWTLTPLMDVYLLALGVEVPGFAQAGEYEFHGAVGFHPTAQLTDSFVFTKAANGASGAGPGRWAPVGDARLDAQADVAGPAAFAAPLPREARMAITGPNPFNPTTTVTLSLPDAAQVRVELVNVLGQTVADLVPESRLAAGRHPVVVDGASLASGSYVVRARVGETTLSQRVLLVK